MVYNTVCESPIRYIVGIDPGLRTGIAIISVDINSFKILSVTSKTFYLDTYFYSEDPMESRTRALYSIILSVMQEYQPIGVGVETPFMNSRFPNAVVQLSQYFSIIGLAVWHALPHVTVHKYPPSLIKKYVGAGGQAMKSDMKENLRYIQEVNENIDLDSLTEHEIDAISIAYLLLKNYRTDNLMLYKL